MNKTIGTISILIISATLLSCSSASAGKKLERALFSGVTAIDVDKTCLPDKCHEMCADACDGIAGQACRNVFDVAQECLIAHPPAEPLADAAAMLAAMDSCLEKNKYEFVKDRCRFSTSELDARFYTDADPKGVCDDIFTEYQDCLKKEKPEIASVAKCQEQVRAKLTTNKCALATADNTRRLFAYDNPNVVRCYLKCEKP